jgi:hypothetical protein
MPKYTKKSKVQFIHIFKILSKFNYLDRPPRSKTARSGADDSTSIDDGVSTCSNLSDLTSIYDDNESKNHFEIIIILLIIFQLDFL